VISGSPSPWTGHVAVLAPKTTTPTRSPSPPAGPNHKTAAQAACAATPGPHNGLHATPLTGGQSGARRADRFGPAASEMKRTGRSHRGRTGAKPTHRQSHSSRRNMAAPPPHPFSQPGEPCHATPASNAHTETEQGHGRHDHRGSATSREGNTSRGCQGSRRCRPSRRRSLGEFAIAARLSHGVAEPRNPTSRRCPARTPQSSVPNRESPHGGTGPGAGTSVRHRPPMRDWPPLQCHQTAALSWGAPAITPRDAGTVADHFGAGRLQSPDITHPPAQRLAPAPPPDGLSAGVDAE